MRAFNSTLATALAFATPALAQTANPPTTATAAADTAQPDEIVVTAQKRRERLQDVPISVGVVGGQAIEQSGALTLENAQYLVPSLNFRKSGTSLNQALFLRGVGTINFSIAAEPSVATVLNGVVLQRAGEGFTDLYDVERIEVLRGPQGTLFGKNASAGVINIVTRAPTDRLEGTVEASYFDDSEYRGRATVNLPFGDGWGARFTGFYGNYDGNIRNRTRGTTVNGYDHAGGRGTIVGKPTGDLTLTLIGDYRHGRDDCCAEIIGTRPTNVAALAYPPNSFQGADSRSVYQNLTTRTNEDSGGVSLQADMRTRLGTFTSITAYRFWDNEEIRDGDFLPTAYVGLNQLHDTGPQRSRTFSQELRLASPGGERLDYVVGAYYSWARSRRRFTRDDIRCSAPVLAPMVPTLIPCSSEQALPTVTFPSGTARFGSVFKNMALFANGTLKVTDWFNLLGGVRYTSDQLDVDHVRTSVNLPTNAAGAPAAFGGINPNFDEGVFAAGTNDPTVIAQVTNGVPFTGKTTKENWSGRAGAQLLLSRQSTFYGSWTRGYKGPAFNIFFNLNTPQTNVIAAESVDSFEAGFKNTLFNGALTVNIAGFYAKYQNYQANNPDLVAGVVTTRLTNAGTVSTRGAELDVIARPLERLTLSGGFAYTDAKVDNFRLPVGAPESARIPSGTPLPNAPKYKAAANADYRLPLSNRFDLQLGGGASYQSSQLSQFDANPAIRRAVTIKEYTLLDARLGIADHDDRWQVTAIVKNILDTSFPALISTGGPGGSLRYLIPREADRYWGVTGRINFGR